MGPALSCRREFGLGAWALVGCWGLGGYIMPDFCGSFGGLAIFQIIEGILLEFLLNSLWE